MRGEAALWRRIYKSMKEEDEREARTHAKARAWRLEPGAVFSAFGAALARERAARGLSQRALAGAVGTSPDQVADLERGKRNPTLRTIARLAHALYLRPSELLARVEADAAARSAEVGPLPADGAAADAGAQPTGGA